jgi:hypothetical protein
MRVSERHIARVPSQSRTYLSSRVRIQCQRLDWQSRATPDGIYALILRSKSAGVTDFAHFLMLEFSQPRFTNHEIPKNGQKRTVSGLSK